MSGALLPAACRLPAAWASLSVDTYISACLDSKRMSSTFQAIAEDRRREILRLLRDRELSVGEVASQFEVTQPAISQHLKVLKRAGLVSERRDGTRRLYRARPEGLGDLQGFLADFFDERLERLRDVVEAEERSGEPDAKRN
jgi:DNA-binding transcriptional ArsR family regulator